MKWFKKLEKYLVVLLGITGTVFILAGCGTQNTTNSELVHPHRLTIGLEGTYPPYSYQKNGKLSGFEVQLGRDVAKQMHLKPKFITTKWDGLVAGLGSHKYDAVMNDMTITPQREKSFLFSKPYIYSRSVLITKKGSDINNIHQIKDKKFAEGTGTNNETSAEKFSAKIVPSDQFTNDLSLIKEGRATGSVNAIDAWNAYKKQHSVKGLEAKVIPVSELKPARIATLLNKKSPKLKKQFSKALIELQKNGTLKKLSDKYFGLNITYNPEK